MYYLDLKYPVMNLKRQVPFFILIFLFFSISAFSQSVIVTEMASLAKDTSVRNQLISSLNGFLKEKDGPNKNNTYVLAGTLPETSALLDELKHIGQSNRFGDQNFYKCHLTNFVKLEANKYLIQLAFIGVDSNRTPVFRAAFRFMAELNDGKFYFCSPLKQNTLSWKSKRLGNIDFHFKDTLIKRDAEAFLKSVSFYDKKLGIANSPIEYYYCDNFPEAQQILGLDYKSDYNGVKSDILTGRENNTSVILSGYNYYNQRFDPHDLWHDRLRIVLNSDTINRPVDEGCAYLYGGSWGIPWKEVLAKFKAYAAANPNADWMNLYIQSKNYEDGDKPLKIAYALNALIAQKIEKEKGFAAVLNLLSCGKRQVGDENYFMVLERVSGISKADFNKEMWKLIK